METKPWRNEHSEINLAFFHQSGVAQFSAPSLVVNRFCVLLVLADIEVRVEILGQPEVRAPDKIRKKSKKSDLKIRHQFFFLYCKYRGTKFLFIINITCIQCSESGSGSVCFKPPGSASVFVIYLYRSGSAPDPDPSINKQKN